MKPEMKQDFYQGNLFDQDDQPAVELPEISEDLEFSAISLEEEGNNKDILHLIDLVCKENGLREAEKVGKLENPDGALKRAKELREEAKYIIYKLGRWQDMISEGAMTQEEADVAVNRAYKRFFETYTGRKNENRRARARRYYKKIGKAATSHAEAA